MTLTGIECGDLYTNKQICTSSWVQKSSTANTSPKRSSEEAGLDTSYPEWGIVESTPSKPDQGTHQQGKVDSTHAMDQAITSTIPPICEMEPVTMVVKKVRNDPPPKRVCTNDGYKSKYYGDNPEIVIVKDWCEEEEKLKVFYKVKGAKPETEEEWHDHYNTVTEALKRYGKPYRRKMDHDFWRIERSMTREERKERVLEFWHAGDIVPQNPFLHRTLWGRGKGYQSVKWDDKNLEVYNQEGEDGMILIDLCEDET